MGFQAIVFLRSSGAPLPGGLGNAGHVGFAFQQSDGTFAAGAVENTSGGFARLPGQTDYWFQQGLSDPVAVMAALGYDAYKIITVGSPNDIAAIAEAESVYHRPFVGVTQNCMNATYDVLTHYGATLPDPAKFANWEPNNWFAGIPGAALSTLANVKLTKLAGFPWSVVQTWQGGLQALVDLSHTDNDYNVSFSGSTGIAVLGLERDQKADPSILRWMGLGMAHMDTKMSGTVSSSIHGTGTVQVALEFDPKTAHYKFIVTDCSPLAFHGAYEMAATFLNGPFKDSYESYFMADLVEKVGKGLFWVCGGLAPAEQLWGCVGYWSAPPDQGAIGGTLASKVPGADPKTWPGTLGIMGFSGSIFSRLILSPKFKAGPIKMESVETRGRSRNAPARATATVRKLSNQQRNQQVRSKLGDSGHGGSEEVIAVARSSPPGGFFTTGFLHITNKRVVYTAQPILAPEQAPGMISIPLDQIKPETITSGGLVVKHLEFRLADGVTLKFTINEESVAAFAANGVPLATATACAGAIRQACASL